MLKEHNLIGFFLHFYSSNCSYNMGGTLYICIYSQPLLCSAGTSKKQGGTYLYNFRILILSQYITFLKPDPSVPAGVSTRTIAC